MHLLGVADRRDSLVNSTAAIDGFHVVVNQEEQYSVWPPHREMPHGWRREGTSGTRDECLAHIAKVWTDMRPLSVRNVADASRS